MGQAARQRTGLEATVDLKDRVAEVVLPKAPWGSRGYLRGLRLPVARTQTHVARAFTNGKSWGTPTAHVTFSFLY